MKRWTLLTIGLFLTMASWAWAYIETPYSLGQTVNESTHVVLVELARIDKEKNLLIYKKVRDIKGAHRTDEIKHNIGQRGFHEREWKNIMKWAEVGKRAVVFHNGATSETCIGDYWYECHVEGEWWAMSHAEPFMLRTYSGDVGKLATAVTDMLKDKEVLVPCFADGKKDQFHERKGKLQLFRASLKRGNYDSKRDFACWGTDPANAK